METWYFDIRKPVPALSSWKSLWRTRRTSRIKRESRKILININEDLGVLGYPGSGMIPTEFNWSALDRFSNSGNSEISVLGGFGTLVLQFFPFQFIMLQEIEAISSHIQQHAYYKLPSHKSVCPLRRRTKTTA